MLKAFMRPRKDFFIKALPLPLCTKAENISRKSDQVI